MNKIILISIAIIMGACNCCKPKSSSTAKTIAPFIIYKTSADYNDKVPLIMNAGKTEIISYPAPSDLLTNGELMQPTVLDEGYLIDNRGITVNTVFTSYTYKEYAALNQVPSLDKLKSSIIDKDPIVEYYNCSKQSKIRKNTKKVNKLIKSDFPDCVRIK